MTYASTALGALVAGAGTAAVALGSWLVLLAGLAAVFACQVLAAAGRARKARY